MTNKGEGIVVYTYYGIYNIPLLNCYTVCQGGQTWPKDFIVLVYALFTEPTTCSLWTWLHRDRSHMSTTSYTRATRGSAK